MAVGDNKVITQDSISHKPSKDSMNCQVNNKLNGLYYYYLEETLYLSREAMMSVDNTSVLGTSAGAICNISYVPFLNLQSDDLGKTPYDTDRFGSISTSTETPPSVFRIRPEFKTTRPMDVCQTKIFQSPPHVPRTGVARNSSFESKLQFYPYRTVAFESNVFDEYEIIPQNILLHSYTTNVATLTAICPVSPGGNFYVSVDGYKNDFGQLMERAYTNTSMDIPSTSSAYSNYMATQKARTAVSTKNSILQGVGTIAAGAITGGISGGPVGAAVGAGVGLIGAYANTMSTINQNMATKEDMRTTPNSLRTMGGDISTRLGSDGKTYVMPIQKVMNADYQRSIGDYFAMYGYKQNMILDLKKNMRSRHYYNYIKTIGCNVKSLTNSPVPKKHLAAIKAIFDNGTTLWHVDRAGVVLGDYQYDNCEVNPPKHMRSGYSLKDARNL